MSARTLLRAATAEAHERVDRLFGRFDLAKPDDYGRFLAAQAVAFLPVEAAIDGAGADAILEDWPERRRGDLLRADLAALAITEPPPIKAPSLSDRPSLLGAIYVLEGSRLGGALLKRSVAAGLPRHFLDANQSHGGWRKLVEKLDRLLYPAESLDIAAATARAVFQRFEAGGLRYLETMKE